MTGKMKFYTFRFSRGAIGCRYFGPVPPEGDFNGPLQIMCPLDCAGSNQPKVFDLLWRIEWLHVKALEIVLFLCFVSKNKRITSRIQRSKRYSPTRSFTRTNVHVLADCGMRNQFQGVRGVPR